MNPEFGTHLRANLDPWKLAVDEAAIERMWRHFELIVEANRVVNLTRITDPAEAAVRHYADSLALVHWARSTGADVRSILDVGSGAGFPAIPLAIARPDWSVTAIDATGKKADFLQRVAADLEVPNLSVEQAHSAHWRPDRRFDVVTFRALARLGEAITACARHVGRSGILVAYKTLELNPQELRDARAPAAEQRLSGQPVFPYELMVGGETLPRALWTYRKK